MKRIAILVVGMIILTAVAVAVTPSAALASGPVLTWSSRTAMPTSRYSMAYSTTLDGDIIVFGGLTSAGGGTTANVERFHPATNSWTSLASMPTPRHGIEAATTADGT